MTRKLLMAAVLAAIVLPVATAHAQIGFGVAGGISAPLGDLSNVAESGYHVTGLLTLGVPLLPVGGRVEGSFNEFNSKGALAGAKTRILSATANATLSTPGLIGPYVIGGIGMYRVSSDCTSCSSSSTNVGFNGGGGLKVGLGGLSVFVEARYHYVPGSNSTTGVGTSSTQFIPVSVGLTF